MSRIIIFATKPEEYELQSIKTAAIREGILQPNCSMNVSEVRKAQLELQRRNLPLNDDVAAGYRLIDRIKADVERSTTHPLPVYNVEETRAPKRRRLLPHSVKESALRVSQESDKPDCSTAPTVIDLADEAEDGLSGMSELSSDSDVGSLSTQSEDVVVLPSGKDDDDDVIVIGEDPAPNSVTQPRRGRGQPRTSHPRVPSRRCRDSMTLTGDAGQRRVALRLYGFKYQKGRVVQRGCDVALGAEITKACFHPNVDKIVLFSADSDFQELMEENIRAENIGGVVKFAKTSWIFGFRRAFCAEHTRDGLSLDLRPTSASGLFQRDNITYVVLDVQFPQIKEYLGGKARRRPWIHRGRNLPRSFQPMPPPPPPTWPEKDVDHLPDP
eukprot:Gregarina_sp_Poly_1__3354@NODE_1968_length_2965_cov_49_616632_g1268_i0_p2_GENE_NODE_1968_length_2965_cov_49_616632_g1268_i0NODE_1968_length_2965_cov_49_616632_g1268_i0_p2_ORF_typecomplete_len445_score50_64NYN/PF01936_18/8_4e02NYN/PF01936_18/2_3e08_NODE_1968_length_2965_cov_49_616632_g1268_i016292780